MITNKVFKAAQKGLQTKQKPSEQYKAVYFCCVSVMFLLCFCCVFVVFPFLKKKKWLRNLNYYTTTVIKTFDLSNSFSYRNYLAISYDNSFMYHDDDLMKYYLASDSVLHSTPYSAPYSKI